MSVRRGQVWNSSTGRLFLVLGRCPDRSGDSYWLLNLETGRTDHVDCWALDEDDDKTQRWRRIA